MLSRGENKAMADARPGRVAGGLPGSLAGSYLG